MRKYKYCRCCTVKNDIKNNKCYSCESDLDDIIYTDNKILYFVLSFLVCSIIYGIDKFLSIKFPIAFDYIEEFGNFIYILLFILCYSFFSKINSPKINNKGIMTSVNKVGKALSFFNNHSLYTHLDSYSNTNERTINKLSTKKTLFILRYLGWFLLLLSILISMKYGKEIETISDIFMIIGILLLIAVPFIIPLILSFKVQYDFIKSKKK